MEPTRYPLWYAAYGGSTSCPSDGRGLLPRVAPRLRRDSVAPAADRAAPSVPAGVRPRRASPYWGAAVSRSARSYAPAVTGGFHLRADPVGGDHDRWQLPADSPIDATPLRCDGAGGGLARRCAWPRTGCCVSRLGGVRPRSGAGVGDRRRSGDFDRRGDANCRGDADRRGDADWKGDPRPGVRVRVSVVDAFAGGIHDSDRRAPAWPRPPGYDRVCDAARHDGDSERAAAPPLGASSLPPLRV